MPERILSTRLDSNESAILADKLQHVKSRIYETRYPEFKATKLIPVSFEIAAGAESYVYYQYDEVGMAKIISDYAADLPRVDVYGKRFVGEIRHLGDSYGFSFQEIRAASMANLNLDVRKALAARRAIERLIDKIAWFGDKDNGLPGFLTNPNIPGSVASAGTSTKTDWAHKTADEIIEDVKSLLNGIPSLTKTIEHADTLLLPTEQHALIYTTPRSSLSDKTIADWIKQAYPNLTIEMLPLLGDIINQYGRALVDGSGDSYDCAMAYRRSEEVLTLEIPLVFTQQPAQENNLEMKIPCEARTGGTPVYLPLSCAILEGI